MAQAFGKYERVKMRAAHTALQLLVSFIRSLADCPDEVPSVRPRSAYGEITWEGVRRDTQGQLANFSATSPEHKV